MWGNTNYFLTCERFLSEACSVAYFFTMCVFTKDKAILHFRFAGLSSVVSELFLFFFSIRTEMKYFVSSNKTYYNKYIVIVAYNLFIFLIVLG